MFFVGTPTTTTSTTTTTTSPHKGSLDGRYSYKSIKRGNLAYLDKNLEWMHIETKKSEIGLNKDR